MTAALLALLAHCSLGLLHGTKLGALSALASLAAAHEESGHCLLARVAGSIFVLCFRQLGKEATFARLLLLVVESDIPKPFLGRWRFLFKLAVDGSVLRVTRKPSRVETLAHGSFVRNNW